MTAISLIDLPAMQCGVIVRTAATGTVRAIRDDEDDLGVGKNERPMAGREAGNAVVLVHDDSWETQYSHGSVNVAKGQRVVADEALGLIGFSGNSTFPHLDFSVRHDGDIVDPFTGAAASEPCDVKRAPLWSVAANK